MQLHLDYFYGGEAEQFSFYRIPKVLFTDYHYKMVSVEAKALYGLMLDRMGLSLRNGWFDEEQRVYIFYTLDDAIEMMNLGHNKAVKLFKELEDIGLIERKKQGQGHPARIYVKNFIIRSDLTDRLVPVPLEPRRDEAESQPNYAADAYSAGEVQTSQKRKSRLPEIGSQDFPKSEVKTSQKRKSRLPEIGSADFRKAEANNTDNKDKEIIYTDLSINPPAPLRESQDARYPQARFNQMDRYREQIKENIDYDLLVERHPYSAETIDGYIELMVEICCSTKATIRICKEDVPTGIVKNRFLKLDSEHISYVMDCLDHNTTRIGNIKAYILAALFNAPVTIAQYYSSLVSHDMAQGFDSG